MAKRQRCVIDGRGTEHVAEADADLWDYNHERRFFSDDPRWKVAGSVKKGDPVCGRHWLLAPGGDPNKAMGYAYVGRVRPLPNLTSQSNEDVARDEARHHLPDSD